MILGKVNTIYLTSGLVSNLIISLILTLIIELLVARILGVKNKDDIKVVICANICTNPVIVYILNFIDDEIYVPILIMLELMVLIVEYMIYKKCLRYKGISPFFISFLCNLISFGCGWIANVG